MPPWPEGGFRGNTDDAAPARLTHCRHGSARHQEGTPGVDAHCLVPGFDRHILDLVPVGPLWCTGIVDQDVEPAIAAEHFIDHSLGIGFDTDIAESGGGSSADLD